MEAIVSQLQASLAKGWMALVAGLNFATVCKNAISIFFSFEEDMFKPSLDALEP